jgi:hypothetical protein
MTDPGYTIEKQGERTYYRSKVKPAFVTPHLHLMERHIEDAGGIKVQRAEPAPPQEKPKKRPEAPKKQEAPPDK